ncbi:hypothetical protein [Methyloversatilis sp.]|uniref:hypothetical protein n=1 Tax=Methyloversatilis sp. TaxID=2569862 RepID=UPI003F6F5806
MPYPGESAGKGGHADFVRNPDVQQFLENCTYLREPTDEEAKELASQFIPAPSGQPRNLPRYVVASDASKSDAPINDKLPSTQVGFLKVSHVLIDMEKYADLIDPVNRFVDPFRVAEMHRAASPVTFTMPGSNIRYRGIDNVKHGFRRALFDQLTVDRSETKNGQVLARMLVALGDNNLVVSSCPICHAQPGATFDKGALARQCSECGGEIYATDFLRLHEGISDFGDNASAMTRMMNAIEHLMLAGFIMQVFEAQPQALSEIAFVMDGPLALFGEPAKLHPRMQRLIFRVNQRLSGMGLPPMLVLGLQKTGAVMDHARLLEKFLPDGVLRVVDDDYRNKFITGTDSPASNFGNETYYGQDFLFKTERGRIFNFAIPYPFEDKAAEGSIGFAKAKIDLARYGSLIERACDLIRHFEMDLYENALVPVALAHRHASISLVPGGKVLDLLVRSGLKTALR